MMTNKASMIPRTAHLNPQAFLDRATKETEDIIDAGLRKKAIDERMAKYYQGAINEPIMQRDVHPYRIRGLAPGEIEIIPFIFMIGDPISSVGRDAAIKSVDGKSSSDLLLEKISGLGGKVYFKVNGRIFFGFPELDLDVSLMNAIHVSNFARQIDDDPDYMMMFTVGAYWFEDIANNPEKEVAEERIRSFVSHTKMILLSEYVVRFPELHPLLEED